MNQFWANDSDSAWYVEAGTAMLYLASTGDAPLMQPRRFVCDVPEGCAVVGISAGLPPGYGLLCMPATGARIRRAGLAGLDELDAPSKARIEQWMREVMRDVDPNVARARKPRTCALFSSPRSEQVT